MSNHIKLCMADNGMHPLILYFTWKNTSAMDTVQFWDSRATAMSAMLILVPHVASQPFPRLGTW